MGETGQVAEICCVCNKPLEGKVYRFGGRSYDEAHYRGISNESAAAARPVFILIGALFLITGLLYLSSDTLQKNDPVLTGYSLRVAAPLLALLPAVLWLILFYRLDRLEPEPKKYVIGVFILSALLSSAIGQPLVHQFFKVQEWQQQNLWIALLASILCVGFIQEFLKYASVRYTVFSSPEFDERVDGIIYSAAAGLGYATAINLEYVFSIPALAIGAGAAKFAINALAHATYAGVMGYFLASAKFDSKNRFWLALGLILAAVVNGVVSTVLVRVGLVQGDTSLGEINHWLRLGTAALLAFVVYRAIFAAVRHLNKKTLAENQ